VEDAVRGFDFGTVTLLGIMNIAIAGIRAFHRGDPLLWMSFATILLAVLIITLALIRLRNGFSEVSKLGIDGAMILRLQSSVYSLAFMANLAILAAFEFGH
jgi:hypothetical protein